MSNLHAYVIPRVGIILGHTGYMDIVDPEDWPEMDYYSHYADREALGAQRERLLEED